MNIVLLDRSSNPVTKSGVTGVNLLTDSGEEKIFEPVYEMSSAYFYFVRPSGDGWEITHRSKGLGSGNSGIAGGFGYADCENYGYQNTNGDWAVGVLVSKNANLSVGSVYTTDELLNG